MRIAIFCHSLVSDWNHGNAHFLRGIISELISRGHSVRTYEPRGGWSVRNLVSEHGDAPIAEFRAAFPELASEEYDQASFDVSEALDGADLALVHEWNEPELVERIGDHRARGGRYTLLFHDTHHRSVTAPHEMTRYHLDSYDGVLAFGNSVAEQYRKRGWGKRVWTWHEAADTRVFRPSAPTREKRDLVWIGNWGDDERTAELLEYLFEPIRTVGLSATIHGVRYPEPARNAIAAAGGEYRGWIPNYRVPEVFANHKLTVHVPRRPYAESLPGVPTIRVFEALACGIPLISAPWSDSEGLFRANRDFLSAASGEEMKRQMRALLNDSSYAAEIAANGRETILSRHSCAHRVDDLFTVLKQLQAHTDPVPAGMGA